MSKPSVHFVCSACGYDNPKWYGRCPSCGEWNTMQEFDTAPAKAGRAASSRPISAAAKLSDINIEDTLCTPTGSSELDRALGGGAFEGSLVLIGGEPGIGKSTLFLQTLARLSKSGHSALYVSGEESLRQIKLRAQRVCEGAAADVLVVAETGIDHIISHLESNAPQFAVVDSIQTLYDSAVSSSPGSISQIRECAGKLNAYAKMSGCTIFLIGHVTKEGALAGPRVLEHMVDTVLYFENAAEYRVLRAVKNRFGSVSEIGVFEMTGAGLTEVADFSAAFIAGREADAPGSCVYCALEGSRPVLVEIQALVSRTALQNPRRTSTGIDYNRSMLVTAVLEKRAGLRLYDQDVYLNVAGGLRVTEPACDLAACMAIVSSVRGEPMQFAAIGEVGLTGEVRSVPQIARRLSECARMGFTKILVPASQERGLPCPPGTQIVGVKSVAAAVAAALR